jgi:UDP-N-acetylmuramyl pentapeptide synthase
LAASDLQLAFVKRVENLLSSTEIITNYYGVEKIQKFNMDIIYITGSNGSGGALNV